MRHGLAMLTLFTTPKAFLGHTGVIQTNAIRSWTLLRPRPEIILFGNEDGTARLCGELDLVHAPDLLCNGRGTPLLSDLFEKAERLASRSLLCYTNADIILLSDFMEMVKLAGEWGGSQVLVARRWDADVGEPLNFCDPRWEKLLKTRVSESGKRQIGGIDYFVFPRGLYQNVPPFAIGRDFWDDWLCWEARRRGARLVDATAMTMAVHQNHPFGMTTEDRRTARKEEVEANWKLNGGWQYCVRRSLPTHIFKSGKISRRIGADYFLHIYYRVVPRLLQLTYVLRRRLGLYRWRR